MIQKTKFTKEQAQTILNSCGTKIKLSLFNSSIEFESRVHEVIESKEYGMTQCVLIPQELIESMYFSKR